MQKKHLKRCFLSSFFTAAEQEDRAEDEQDAASRSNGDPLMEKQDAEHGCRHRLNDAERGGGADGENL